MNGARRMAVAGLEQVLRNRKVESRHKLSILDLCSGDGEIAEFLEGYGEVFSVDFDPLRSKSTRHPKLIRDVAYTPWFWAKRNSFDVVVCTYSMQQIWGDEPAVWREVRRALAPGGLFIVTGRHDARTPHIEYRFDPGRSDTLGSVCAISIASGLHPVEVIPMRYTEGTFYREEDLLQANAYFGVFRKGCQATSWDRAKVAYRLLETEGWMSEEELRFLYETAAGQAGGTVVEIGTFLGRGACAILAGLREGGGGRLVCVDTFDGRGTSRHEEMKKLGAEGMMKLHREATRNRGLPDPFFYVGGSTDPKNVGVFEREGVDWAFIDGSHDAQSVADDVFCWKDKVARGGILSGHDYHTDFPGVIEGVSQHFKEVQKPAGSIWMVRA